MGTDIHMRAEFKPEPDAPWEAVGSIFTNDYYDPIAAAQIDKSYRIKYPFA